MTYSLTRLAGVLKSAGLKVAPVDDWEVRGRGDVGSIVGVLCHHTATSSTAKGNMPTLDLLVKGRSDLPGPLSQLGLGRDGTYYVIAAGKCNHAGIGEWQRVEAGNARFIGIEAEHPGLPGEPWPEVQMDAYRRGVAAILAHIGSGPEFCAGHKEYALPKNRKSDPSFDMPAFRASVAAIMNGTAPRPTLIPAAEPATRPGIAPRPTLRRGATGALVREIQQRADTQVDGYFGPVTEAAVRELQRRAGLVPDGIVGPKTWLAFDRLSP